MTRSWQRFERFEDGLDEVIGEEPVPIEADPEVELLDQITGRLWIGELDG